MRELQGQVRGSCKEGCNSGADREEASKNFQSEQVAAFNIDLFRVGGWRDGRICKKAIFQDIMQ